MRGLRATVPAVLVAAFVLSILMGALIASLLKQLSGH